MSDQELTGKAGGVESSTPSPNPSRQPGGESEGGGAIAQTGVAPAEGATAEGQAPTIAAGQQQAGAQPPAGAGQPQPPAAPQVDLTQSEEFRRWQAARDRREAQLQAHLVESQRRIDEMQQHVEQLRLRDADPEQVAAYYQEQMQRLQQERQQAQQQAQLRGQVEDAASRLLHEHGLDVNTPGLDWSGGATWEGYAKLAESVANMERLRAQQQSEQTRTVATAAAQQAKTEALEQAGVTRVNTATGTAAPKDLRADFEQEAQKLRGSGDVAGYAALKRKYRGLGLEV